MQDSNFQRFQNNKAKLRANVQEMLNNPNTAMPIEPKPIRMLSPSEFSVENITKAIENIDITRDSKLGITRHRYQDAEGKAHIIRDTRKMHKSYPTSSRYSNTMLMLSTARAALFMIESELATKPKDVELIKAKDRLCKLTSMSIFHREKTLATVKGVQEFNKMVLDVLKAAPIEDKNHLKKNLQNTSHMMNFRNEAQHITTISKVKDSQNIEHAAIETEVMLLGFTSSQKKMFLDIKANKEGKIYPWFNALSPYNQLLVKDALNYAMDANGNMIHPFPTQVREIMPGLRNAYYKETATIDKGVYVQVGELFHSGSLYLKMKTKFALVCVNEMASQLKSFMSASYDDKHTKTTGKPLIDVVLNSPANIFNAQEGRVALMVKNAMTSIGSFFSITPLNILRVISGSDFAGYETFLSEFSKALTILNPQLAKDLNKALQYIQKGGSEAHAREEIASAREKYKDSPEMLKILDTLDAAIRAKTLMESYAFIFDRQNRNLQLAKVFTQLNFDVNNEEGVVRQHFKNAGQEALLYKVPQINMHCMSGIDRLGVVANRCSNDALNRYYRVAEGSDKYHENSKNIVNAGHTQAMPNLNNSGAHGVKADSKLAIPKDDEKDAQTLFTSGASSNKLKYGDVSLNLKELDNKPHYKPDNVEMRYSEYKKDAVRKLEQNKEADIPRGR